ncbi:o-succinylbenzoate synthase, partial [Microvirga sp. 3-52]|nr:o-succinylbenzoate synthase [Microvirga sp. 3-52]
VIEIAKENDLAIWIGGMIEFGISKAHNLALASLPQFSLPGDFSASTHFWHEDPVEPSVEIENGVIKLSKRPGIGVNLNKELVEKYLIESY